MTQIDHGLETFDAQPEADVVTGPQKAIDIDSEAPRLHDLLDQYEAAVNGYSRENLDSPADQADVLGHLYYFYDPAANRITARRKYLAQLEPARGLRDEFHALAAERNKYHREQHDFFVWEYEMRKGQDPDAEIEEPVEIEYIPRIEETFERPAISLGETPYYMTSLSLARNENGDAELAFVRLQNSENPTQRNGLSVLVIPLDEHSVELMQAGEWERFAYHGYPQVQVGGEYNDPRAVNFLPFNGDPSEDPRIKISLVASGAHGFGNYLEIDGIDGHELMLLEQQPAQYSTYLSRHRG